MHFSYIFFHILYIIINTSSYSCIRYNNMSCCITWIYS
nr:MAG TPA: hypothetical protein [Caudoviricetes sp.]DAY42227.1 MAG TPA: hypothetical protein [Caudoviricetes sp.]